MYVRIINMYILILKAAELREIWIDGPSIQCFRRATVLQLILIINERIIIMTSCMSKATV